MNEEKMQNKIEQLEKELNELKKITKYERWKPYTEGYNIKGLYYGHALPPGFKNERFRTKELAKLRQKQIEAENELFNIWDHLVGDWRPNNKDQSWHVVWNEYENVPISFTDSQRGEISLYKLFPSEELAMKQYELASDHARAYMRGEF